MKSRRAGKTKTLLDFYIAGQAKSGVVLFFSQGHYAAIPPGSRLTMGPEGGYLVDDMPVTWRNIERERDPLFAPAPSTTPTHGGAGKR